MKNPFKHHTHGTTLQHPQALGGSHEHTWRHMQQDVDPDCVRDPGSDLKASWDLEGAALDDDVPDTDAQSPPTAQ